MVVPNNTIAEKTFTEALDLAHRVYGRTLKGAVMSANKRSCLMLRELSYDLSQQKKIDESWGDKQIAYQKLKINFKPQCVTEVGGNRKNKYCKYYDAQFPIPKLSEDGIPLPIFEAEYVDERLGITKPSCLYITIERNIKKFDVVFHNLSETQEYVACKS